MFFPNPPGGGKKTLYAIVMAYNDNGNNIRPHGDSIVCHGRKEGYKNKRQQM